MYVGEWTPAGSNEQMNQRAGLIHDVSSRNRSRALLVKRPSTSSGRPEPVEGRISLGIRAYGLWRIAAGKDAQSPFRSTRYWISAIGSFLRIKDASQARAADRRFPQKDSRITRDRVLAILLLAITINGSPARSVLHAEDATHIRMHMAEMRQAPRKGPVLEGSQMVRPSPREREAVHQLLALNPRPKTLKEADVKYLQGLRDKASWFVLDRRMVHEIWAEVNGKEWRDIP